MSARSPSILAGQRLAGCGSITGQDRQLDWRGWLAGLTVFSLPKTACLIFLRPEGMDMTMVLYAPKSRLAMDIASRG